MSNPSQPIPKMRVKRWGALCDEADRAALRPGEIANAKNPPIPVYEFSIGNTFYETGTANNRKIKKL